MKRVTILDFVQSPDRMEAYRTWLQNPVTQELIALLRTLARPVGLGAVSGDSALYAHGVQVGYTQMLDVLCELEETASRVKTELTSQGLVADYGAADIVKALNELSVDVAKVIKQ